MIWLTWRQFRACGRDDGRRARRPRRHPGPDRPGPGRRLLHRDRRLHQPERRLLELRRPVLPGPPGTGLAVTAVVLVLPALIGLFWGAPLIARELEAGTHRLVWNQSITRTRWLAVKLGLVGLAAIAAAGLGSLAVDWWSDPIDKAAAAADAVLADGAAAVRRTRHRPDRLRGLRLRARRDRRDAGPPHGPRDGHHPGRLRRRPDRHAATGPAPPHPAQPLDRRDHAPRTWTSSASRSRTTASTGRRGRGRPGRLGPVQPHRRRVRTRRRHHPVSRRPSGPCAPPERPPAQAPAGSGRATSSRRASPSSSGSATGNR